MLAVGGEGLPCGGAQTGETRVVLRHLSFQGAQRRGNLIFSFLADEPFSPPKLVGKRKQGRGNGACWQLVVKGSPAGVHRLARHGGAQAHLSLRGA